MAFTYNSGQLGFAIPFNELMAGGTTAMNARLDEMVSLGADSVRADMWLNQIKTGATTYNWAEYDTFVNAADARGLEVIGLINGFGNLSTSTGRTDVASFAGVAAARYGTKVDAWEFGNEMNMASITPANYTTALQGVYNAIKAVDSTDTVITGGNASVPANEGSYYGAKYYLEQIYATGGKNYFDAVAHHPYDYPYTPDTSPSWGGTTMLGDLRAVMVANGDSAKDIWLTEMGAPTSGGSGAVTQANQAATVQQISDFGKANDWIGPIDWYSLQDRSTGTGQESFFGLKTATGTQKTAYGTYDTIASADGLGSVVTPPAGDTPTFTTANFTGTSAPETIIGNDLANVIDGQAGNDIIKGGLGNDKLVGSYGTDTLTGGAGNDLFDWNLFSQFGAAGTPDVITDFTPSATSNGTLGDRIDVYDLDANNNSADGNQAFTFVGSSWLSAPGQVGAYQDVGNNITYVQFNTDSDLSFDYEIVLTGLPTLVAANFVL